MLEHAAKIEGQRLPVSPTENRSVFSAAHEIQRKVQTGTADDTVRRG